MTFHSYLGLKHEFGADPRLGKAADCVLLSFALLEEAGIYHPQPKKEWFDLARAGMWDALAAVWKSNTVSINSPEPWSVALHWNRPRTNHPKLGISTVVQNDSTIGLVMLNARKGVVWLPLNTPGLPTLSFCRFTK